MKIDDLNHLNRLDDDLKKDYPDLFKKYTAAQTAWISFLEELGFDAEPGEEVGGSTPLFTIEGDIHCFTISEAVTGAEDWQENAFDHYAAMMQHEHCVGKPTNFDVVWLRRPPRIIEGLFILGETIERQPVYLAYCQHGFPIIRTKEWGIWSESCCEGDKRYWLDIPKYTIDEALLTMKGFWDFASMTQDQGVPS
jgi:hypothetical protein